MAGNAFALVLLAHHEAGDVLQEQQRHLPLAAQFYEVRALLRTFRKQHAVVGHDAHRHAFNVRKAAHQRGTEARLEFVEFAAIHNARNDLVHVVGLARVGGYHAVQFFQVVQRRARFAQVLHLRLAFVQRGHGLPRQRQRVRIVLGQVVGHARKAGVYIAAAQFLGRHHLANGGLHQRRAAQENGALVLHDDGFVTHGRHVGAARRARTHDHRNLRNALRAHVGLVVEDAAKVVAVGEHLVLVGQVGAARIHQVDAGQVVLHGNFLCPQVLLHRHGVVGAALHRGVVAHDHAFHASHAAYACNHAGCRCRVVVQVQRGQRGHFQKRGAGVQQHFHAFARQQLAAGGVLGARGLAAAQRHPFYVGTQVIDQRLHGRGMGLEVGGTGIELGRNDGHGGGVSGRRGSA